MFSDSSHETAGISSLFSCTRPPLPYSDIVPLSSNEGDDHLSVPNIKMSSQHHQKAAFNQRTPLHKYSETIEEENNSEDDSSVGCHWMEEINNDHVVLPENVFRERAEEEEEQQHFSQDCRQLSTQMGQNQEERQFLNSIIQEQKNIFEQTLLKIAEPVFETQASSLQTYQSVTAQMETVREQISSIQQKSLQYSKDLSQRNEEIEGKYQSMANQDIALRQYCVELGEALSDAKQQMSEKIHQTNQLSHSIKDFQDKIEIHILSQVNAVREKVLNAERKQAEASEEIQIYMHKASDEVNEALKKTFTIFEANLDGFKNNLSTKINTSDVKTLFSSMNDGFYDEIEKTLAQIQEDIRAIQTSNDNQSQFVSLQELSKELQAYYVKLKSEMAKTQESQSKATMIINSFQSNYSLVQHQRSRIDALEAVVTSLLLQKSESDALLQQELSKGELLSRKAEFLDKSLIKMNESFELLKRNSQNTKALQNSNSQILLLRHENKELRQTLNLKEKALNDQAIILAAFKEQIQNQKDQLNSLVKELQEIKSERKRVGSYQQQIEKSSVPSFFAADHINQQQTHDAQNKKCETIANVSMLSSIVSAKSAGDDSLSEAVQKIDDLVGSPFKRKDSQDHHSSPMMHIQSQQLQPFFKLSQQSQQEEIKLKFSKHLSFQAKDSSQTDIPNNNKMFSKQIKTEASPSRNENCQKQQSMDKLYNPKIQIQQLQQRIASYQPQYSKQHQHSKSSSVLQQTLPYSQFQQKDSSNSKNDIIEITNNQTVKNNKPAELIVSSTSEIQAASSHKQTTSSPHYTSNSQNSTILKEQSVSQINSGSLVAESMDIERLIKRRLLYNNALKNASETKLKCKIDKNNQLKDEQGKYIYSNEGHPISFTTEQLNYLLQEVQILSIDGQAESSQ